MSVNTFAAFSRSTVSRPAFGGLAGVVNLVSLLPEARGVSEGPLPFVVPRSQFSGGMLVKVSSSFSSGTCAKRDVFSFFRRQK